MSNSPKENTMTKATDIKNLRLWDALGKTDPAATKKITGKRFGGTAIKPMWLNKRMTEVFGPAGTGWGMDKPEFELMHGTDGQVLVFATVGVWYREVGSKDVARVFGVGGDFVVKKESSGMFFDDEAFKKAYTDALGNAFKFIGAAADVHMGLFDDSKYVQEVNQQFRASEDALGQKVDALTTEISETSDIAKLEGEVQDKVKELLDELALAKRQGEFAMLRSTYMARRAKLKPAASRQTTVDPPEALAGEPTEPTDQQ